jgi:hypothetical protein
VDWTGWMKNWRSYWTIKPLIQPAAERRYLKISREQTGAKPLESSGLWKMRGYKELRVRARILSRSNSSLELPKLNSWGSWLLKFESYNTNWWLLGFWHSKPKAIQPLTWAPTATSLWLWKFEVICLYFLGSRAISLRFLLFLFAWFWNPRFLRAQLLFWSEHLKL